MPRKYQDLKNKQELTWGGTPGRSIGTCKGSEGRGSPVNLRTGRKPLQLKQRVNEDATAEI